MRWVFPAAISSATFLLMIHGELGYHRNELTAPLRKNTVCRVAGNEV